MARSALALILASVDATSPRRINRSSVEPDPAGPEALGRGKREFVDEGEIVVVELEDRDG